MTVRPVAGAAVTVAGMEVSHSSFLRFQGLHMSEGFLMDDGEEGYVSHDYQFVEDTFENTLIGIVLYADTPIKKVLIEKNYMFHVHLDAEAEAECSGGYYQGQDVSIAGAEGVTIAHNTFKQAQWHYLQGGGSGPEGVTVEHNLFEGRRWKWSYSGGTCEPHLNVWQIYQGGDNDRFTNNIVLAEPGQYASTIILIFQNGPGGAVCHAGTNDVNTVVENNLFGPRAAESYATEIVSQDGMTFTHNTFVGEGQFGVWFRDCETSEGSGKYQPMTNATIEHNIAGPMYGNSGGKLGEAKFESYSFSGFGSESCTEGCKWDYNVSTDPTDKTGCDTSPEYCTTDWTPKWQSEEPGNPDYYLPSTAFTNNGSKGGTYTEAGYQGHGGP